MPKIIIVELNEVDAASFVRWRQYQSTFELLVENRVFDIRNGYAQLNFDKLGNIGSIDLHMNVFRAVSYPQVGVDKPVQQMKQRIK